MPLCPDFVVELISPSDSLEASRQKIVEYRDNGTRLGWLINRKKRQVEICRPHQPSETLENPKTLSGESVLPDFTLELAPIW